MPSLRQKVVMSARLAWGCRAFPSQRWIRRCIASPTSRLPSRRNPKAFGMNGNSTAVSTRPPRSAVLIRLSWISRNHSLPSHQRGLSVNLKPRVLSINVLLVCVFMALP